ncbi:DUF749 family protein [Methanopyrus sp. KOL6]|uniref:DUF749 family protein n=1 Tax=Methanopyrus sp. KOL6 TaxID=1937004 RepID=UPI0012F990AD|nr:DUF749 family protein [Methanopyrus sp. KOL6]
MFVAKYLGSARYSELDEELKNFARLKAHLAGVDLDKDPELIVFNIEGTSSYYIVFLEEVESEEDVERLLREDMGAELSRDSKASVKRALNR